LPKDIEFGMSTKQESPKSGQKFRIGSAIVVVLVVLVVGKACVLVLCYCPGAAKAIVTFVKSLVFGS
jgi:hypothetical protein